MSSSSRSLEDAVFEVSSDAFSVGSDKAVSDKALLSLDASDSLFSSFCSSLSLLEQDDIEDNSITKIKRNAVSFMNVFFISFTFFVIFDIRKDS